MPQPEAVPGQSPASAQLAPLVSPDAADAGSAPIIVLVPPSSEPSPDSGADGGATLDADGGADAGADVATGTGVALAPEVGFYVPWSALGPTWTVDLETDFTPFFQRRVGLLIDLGYAQPEHGAAVTDPRVPGGGYTFNVTQQEITLTLGPKVFIGRVDRDVLGFIGGGVKVYGLRTTGTASTASAQGQSFGSNQELAVTWGGALRGGVGKKAGPGRVIADLELAYTSFKGKFTGPADGGDLSLELGYLFAF